MSFLQNLKGPGQFAVIALVLAITVAAVYFAITRSSSQVASSAYDQTYICTETGKAFSHRNQLGESLPILSPFSGKNTGMPAEPCYWTADGGVKQEPTWVLLNESVGNPEPTFCPDCGRLVVGHNPAPTPGRKPPPTQEEYLARRQSRSSEASQSER